MVCPGKRDQEGMLWEDLGKRTKPNRVEKPNRVVLKVRWRLHFSEQTPGPDGSLRGPGDPQGTVEALCSGVRRRILMCGPARLWCSGLLVTVSQYLG